MAGSGPADPGSNPGGAIHGIERYHSHPVKFKNSFIAQGDRPWFSSKFHELWVNEKF